MQPRRFGSTGLTVSPLGLGTMTWGRDTDAHDAGEMVRAFLDSGGTVIDTAASYADGAAEEIIAGLLHTGIARRDVVLVGKSGVQRTASGSLVLNAGRGALLDDLDASLVRLGTDHLDLWLVQAPDRLTPANETATALEIAVRSGRARYVGVANYPGWASAQIAGLMSSSGSGIGLAGLEVEYSLLERGIEREAIPAAQATGLGVIGWSSLGRGVLTGKYRRVRPADSRAASAHLRAFVEPYLTEQAAAIVEALAVAAGGLGKTPLAVALAWARDAPGMSSVLIGPRNAIQLSAALEATALELPPEIRSVLDEVTAPPLGYPERRS